jgi:hypothetical protein
MNAAKWKTEAETMGLSWGLVLECYRELRHYEHVTRARKWEIRELAWKTLPMGHGGRLKRAYREAFDGGDMTLIPGFDDVAKELANTEIPELGQDDPAAALWDLITAPKDLMPPADETMRHAIDRALELNVEAADVPAADELEAVPF